MLGIGIGILIATCFMVTEKTIVSLSKSQIETRAYNYGMRYPEDMKVINSKDVGK
ncbi:hypothetical protein SAMN02745134_00426 [Clostridium acidisoli DSM 12555]|jgi:hypothetical protein|uniref:Uncharacterized protein n=1 Tax=Clostridium acidisoli DSM 12555 TaxID=1121291 RepID=A0A1W1X1F3_9CLOT|nr:hypothetical protein [Clostridium acidisoli]SMC17772.1 hypothetical protein SAMN02745134_00426 [Clostridium acidisoli DSM 12555]